MNEPPSIDDIDLAIVRQLQDNGRATNKQIAQNLGLTAATVSARIRRMEADDKLRVIAVSDFSAHGYNILMEVAIEVHGRAASEVAEDLAKMPEAFAVHLVTGRYDIDMMLVLKDFDGLKDMMLSRIMEVEGVRSITPTIAVDIIKYQFDVAPIEAGDGS